MAVGLACSELRVRVREVHGLRIPFGEDCSSAMGGFGVVEILEEEREEEGKGRV